MQRTENLRGTQATAFDTALTMAFFESLLVWGVGFMWYWGAAFEGHVFWSTVALLLFGSLLLAQLGAGALYWILGLNYQSAFKDFITSRPAPHFENVSDYTVPNHTVPTNLQQSIENALLGKRYEFRGKVLIYALLLTLISPLFISSNIMFVLAVVVLIWGVIKFLKSLLRWSRSH